jgi:hypothetical protein
MDCTEQRVQRPSRKQKCWYSGKKKCHTVKNKIMIAVTVKIVYTSKDAPGSVHDLTVRRRGIPLPKEAGG